MKIVRYDVNPFLADMVLKIKKKNVQVSPMGKDRNILVNEGTGQSFGTHVTTYKKVDSEQFVKLFAANIALAFDLKAAGFKSFMVLIWAVQNKVMNKDLIMLDSFTLDDFLSAHEAAEPPVTLSLSTFQRGMKELENSKIIAKNVRKGWYFINPNFVFNGDRIAFTTLIEKADSPRKEEQQELPLDALDEIQ